MDNKEAIKYLIPPIATSTEPSAEYLKQKEAYDLAIKALERPKGEWVRKEYRRFLPRDSEPYYNDDTYDEKTHSVIDTDIVCSECGAPKHFYHNFCGNCGAIMKGGAPEGLGDD